MASLSSQNSTRSTRFAQRLGGLLSSLVLLGFLGASRPSLAVLGSVEHDTTQSTQSTGDYSESLSVVVNDNLNRYLVVIVNFNSCKWRVTALTYGGDSLLEPTDPRYLIKIVDGPGCSTSVTDVTRSEAWSLPSPAVGTGTLSVTAGCRPGYTCTSEFPEMSLTGVVLFNADQTGSFAQGSTKNTWNGSYDSTYPGVSYSSGRGEIWVSSLAIDGNTGPYSVTRTDLPYTDPPDNTIPTIRPQQNIWEESTGFGASNLEATGGTQFGQPPIAQGGLGYVLASFDTAMTNANAFVVNGCTTPPCTEGASVATYRVVARYTDGSYSAGADATIYTSVSDLTASDFNTISWSPVSGSSVTYDVYRTVGPPSDSSTGRIATGLSGTSFNDIGGAPISEAVPRVAWVIQMIGFKPQDTTAISGVEFEASPSTRGTLLRWRTGAEVSNLGFNIYREDDGVSSRVNPSLIGGSVFLVGPRTPLSQGRGYEWVDAKPAGPTTRYWLEAVDLNGTTERFEPRSVLAPAAEGLLDAEFAPALALCELGESNLMVAGGVPGIPAAEEVDLAPDVEAFAVADAGALASQQGIAAGQAVKLSVSREGWYRVTAAQLAAAGFNPSSTRNLQLYSDGVEQAMVVTGASNPKAPAYVLEFHGRPLDTPYTATRTYWLVDGKKPGLRFAGQAATRATVPAPSSFPFVVERKDRTIYFAALVNNGDASNFFGPVVSQTPITQTLVLGKVDSKASGEWPLQVALQGVTLDANHSVEVRVNGNVAGRVTFRNQERGTATLKVPRSWLVEGANAVELTALGGSTDVSLVDSIRLTYPHRYEAEAGVLKLVAPAGAEIQLEGADPATRIVDVTDPRAGVELVVSQAAGSSVARAVVPRGFGFSSGQRTLLAFGATRPLAPEEVKLNAPSAWSGDRSRADLTIVTHAAFLPAARKLQAWRQSQRLSVRVVDVEDLYDELSYGAKDPAAIRSYLASSISKYALLIGDASIDPRNYLGLGSWDLLPTKLVPTTYLKTASDDWFVTSETQGTVRIPIGRIAVRTGAEALAVVDKLIAFDEARVSNPPWQGQVVHVADTDDPAFTPSFEEQVAALDGLVPATLAKTDILVGDVGAAAAREAILSSLDAGATLFTFVGHGSQDRWSKSNVFNTTDASGLTGAPTVPVMLPLNCLNGVFMDAYADSLAERLQKQSGGAAAIWASSGVTSPYGQVQMAKAFYGQVFTTPGVRLGDAVKAAKKDVTDPDVKGTWILFGDPTMIVR